jgi:hypothetical protein
VLVVLVVLGGDEKVDVMKILVFWMNERTNKKTNFSKSVGEGGNFQLLSTVYPPHC